MIWLVALKFIDIFVSVFNLLLIGRVLSSYIMPPESSFYRALVSLTEPLLLLVRKFLPATAGIDWAPLVMFFLLQGLQYLAHWVLGA